MDAKVASRLYLVPPTHFPICQERRNIYIPELAMTWRHRAPIDCCRQTIIDYTDEVHDALEAWVR